MKTVNNGSFRYFDELEQDGRPPPAYFLPSDFAIPFFKKIPSSAIFDNFFKLEIFLISWRNLSIQVEKRQFYDIISFDTHSTANFPPFTNNGIFQVFLIKTHRFFSKKKKQISYGLKNSLSQSHSTANVL